jgi:hypothetical protein
MKDTLYLITALALLSSTVGWFWVTLDSDSAWDVSTVTFWWRFESTTLDATHDYYSGGDNTADVTGNAACGADADKLGTNGGDYPATANQDYFSIDISNNDLADSGEGRVGFWLYVVAMPTTPTDDFMLFSITEAWKTDIIHCNLENSDDIKCGVWNTLGNAEVATTSASLTTGNWYWVEYYWDITGGEHGVYVYNASNTLLDSDVDTETLYEIDLSGSEKLYIGDVDNVTGDDFYIDHFIISDDHTVDLRDYNATDSYTGS